MVLQKIVEDLQRLPVRLTLNQKRRLPDEKRFQTELSIDLSIGRPSSVKLLVQTVPRVLRIGIKEPFVRLAKLCGQATDQ